MRPTLRQNSTIHHTRLPPTQPSHQCRPISPHTHRIAPQPSHIPHNLRLHNHILHRYRPVILQRPSASRRQVNKRLLPPNPRILPPHHPVLLERRVRTPKVPSHPLNPPCLVDVPAHSQPGPHAPERPAESLTTRGAAEAGLVAVGARRCVCDDDVRVEGDVVPERGEVRRRQGVLTLWRGVVGEGPEAVARGVRGAEDGEGGARAGGGGEGDSGGGVVEVGYAGGAGQEGEAVGRGLRRLVVEMGAVEGVEGAVEGEVVVSCDDDLGFEGGLFEPGYCS